MNVSLSRSLLLSSSLSLAAGLLAAETVAQGAFGDSLASRRISATAGGFAGGLDDGDLFGGAIASLGDLDGDGIEDVAVGVMTDDDGGTDRGAVWILFLKANGSVKAAQKISDLAGGFSGVLHDDDRFGIALAAVGDLDDDGVIDLAVGASRDDDGGADRGAVWILFLKPDGTVKFHRKISSTQGAFTGALDDGDHFGTALAGLGDLNGDGWEDLAVGAQLDDDGAENAGAVWILFLRPTGAVDAHQKISSTEGGFPGGLDGGDWFGCALSAADCDLDGLADLAVGARFDDDGGADLGAVWVLFLDAAGQVTASSKISATSGGFTGTLASGDSFGQGLSLIPDLDDDGCNELIIGAPLDDEGGPNRGAVWVISLSRTGSVVSQHKISSLQGGAVPAIADGDQFGWGIAVLDDAPSKFGYGTVAIGARTADDGGADRGVLHLVQLSSGTWTNLANAKAGGPGYPTSTGSDGLVPGGSVSFLLANAKTHAATLFVVGLTHLGAPLFGGVLVPEPLILLPGFNTGFVGKVLVNGTLPAGLPSGVPIYSQFWVADPAGIGGYSASNGLAFVTP